MGCQSSKLDLADDSIHVILSHAANGKKGVAHNCYVPRQPHPLLNRDQSPPTATESDNDSTTNEMDRLLFHAAHHNDTIDSRDLDDYGTDADEEDKDEAPQQ